MKTKTSAGYLVKQGSKFLLGRPFHDVYWSVFKGGVHNRETIFEAARRELNEEAGINIDRLYRRGIIKECDFNKLIYTYTITKKKLEKEVFIYLLELPKSYVVKPECLSFVEDSGLPEICQFHWFNFKELEGALFKSQLGLVKVVEKMFDF